jgi:SAM-dependent methyltransferase
VADLTESSAQAGRMWGDADYGLLAARFAPVHDDLVRRLAPQPGERWLDVATGTGGVAVRAAAAGALVTGLDISDSLLEQARAKGKEAGVDVEWVLGDAQALPFGDGELDVVSSCFGAIFAPDVAAVASELARVLRPGGRLGLTAWRAGEGPHAVTARFAPAGGPNAPEEWGQTSRLRSLLEASFELTVDTAVWDLVADSPVAAWELVSTGAPPVKAMLGALEPDQRQRFRAEMLDCWRGFERDGAVVEPRRYLIATGRRR